MRRLLLASTAAFTLAAAPTLTYAACTITDDKTEQELSKVEGISSGDYGNVRRDVRTLRSAASVLQRYGKDDACQQVVASMSELLRDPRASLEMRTKSMSALKQGTSSTAEQPKATTETNAETTGSTDPAVKTSAPESTMTMEQRRTNAVPFMERKTVMSAADLIGADVYGTNNDSVGEIEDVIVSPENMPSYALISYGGFLGIGEDQAAVPMSVLRVSADNYVFVPMTAEQLRGAPKLQRGTADWWANDDFRSQNDEYYKKLKS